MSDPVKVVISTPAPVTAKVNASAAAKQSLNTNTIQASYASLTGSPTDSTAMATALNAKQKAITSGTATPSGGVDGDIYLQYT